MSTERTYSSVPERIAFTGGFRCATDKHILCTLSTFADFKTGRGARPSLATLTARAGYAQRRVERSLARLEAGGWIVGRRRHRHATEWTIQTARLATNWRGARAAGPVPTDNNLTVTDTNLPVTCDKNLPVTNDGPIPCTYTEHTHSAADRAPAAAEPREADLPLTGLVPAKRCTHRGHGWCDGRVHVPRDLHYEMLDRLGTEPGESPRDKTDRLATFYAGEMARLPATQSVPDPYAFWKAAFRLWTSGAAPQAPPATRGRSERPLTEREIEEAKRIRANCHGRCPHAEHHEHWRDCVRAIALERRIA